MITRLTGKLAQCDVTEVVVDVQGVGYAVTVPLSTYDRLPAVENTVTLFTHLHMREDGMTLFGFATEDERKLFRLLITVTGIGPRLALNVLSCMAVDTFCRALAAGDIKALGRVNGIGKRTAERMVVELREKVAELAPAAALGSRQQTAPVSREVQDAVAALETLGFKSDLARKTVQQVAEGMAQDELSVEILIRKALKTLNS